MKLAGETTVGGGLLRRIVTGPLRALRRARDLYVRGLTRCAGAVGAGGVLGYPGDFAFGTPAGQLFRSASWTSSSREDDLRELIRAASQGAMRSVNMDSGGRAAAVRRSQSVGMGRIDEDSPCEFAGFDGCAPALHTRSRSCAVPSKRKVAALS